MYPSTLKEDKPLKVVLRGIPVGETVEDITEDLQQQKFTVLKCTRINKKVRNENSTKCSLVEMPLVVVEVPRKEAHIYEIVSVLGSAVIPESLGRPSISQCHRCQQFNHSQSCCFAPPMCVKCGQDHLSVHSKNNGKTAFCGLCKTSGHPANWSGCPKWPKYFDGNNEQVAPQNPTPKTFTSSPLKPGVSYAQAGSPPIRQSTQSAPTSQNQHSSNQETQNRNDINTLFTMMDRMMTRFDRFITLQENSSRYGPHQ